MTVFNIIKFRKIKSDRDIRSAEKHNFRQINVPNASVEKEYLNQYYRGTSSFFEKFSSLQEMYNFKVREKGNNASVKVVEFIISASPEFFQNKSKEEISKYFADNLDILNKHFFKEKGSLISFVVHYDETTPHLHAIYVPIVKKGNVYALSCKELLGGKSKCIFLQDVVYSELVSRGWNVSRGRANKKAQYNDIQKFYAKINETKEDYNNMCLQNKIFYNYIVKKGLSNDFKKYINTLNTPSEKPLIKAK